MTLQNELGAPALTYNLDYGVGALATNVIISASGSKLAMVGQVWHPTVKSGTIKIRKVHFRCGALTLNNAGGTELRVSLQNVSATAGPPYQPDGSQDQFYDFKTATTALSASAANVTGNLSADRDVDLTAVNIGDANSRWIAIVWEFNVFNTSDSLIVSALGYAGGAKFGLGGNAMINTGTWAVVSQRLNNVVLECDDGTFAFVLPGQPSATGATASANVASTGAVRRAGLKFKFPTARKIDRAALWLTVANGSDGRIVLYDSDGTTELASVAVDNDAVQAAATALCMEVAFQAVTLQANTFYRLVFVGGTATASTVQYFDVAAAGHLDGMYIGQNAHWTQHDGSNWADTTTRQPFFGIGISATDDGLSASAGHIASRQLTGM